MEDQLELSGELQCVGRLEIAKPKPVGFICGTLPVPTDDAYRFSQSALVPSSETITAPRYRMLPTETDLNSPPLISSDSRGQSGPICHNLARRCDALAVSGLTEYGDEIDVVAPTDILKQIFKIPYSKARLSVAVKRIGQTLILNTGPDIEEGEKLVRRQSNQTKSGDQSILLNFAMHSVRAEACDCPPSSKYSQSEDQSSTSTMSPGVFESREPGTVLSSSPPKQGCSGQFFCQRDEEDFLWSSGKQKKHNKRRDALRKTSKVGENPSGPVQESEKFRRGGNDEFLRVLFWQFHNFRMLLGSDLLLFSNEKYVAVSLHLWDVARQVTPLTWLEAWLDNVMASVPELAICYHQNGVVQGYELIKTDDIFLLKGISDDGTPAFHPQVVQQNGLSVLRFLQDNCKQDPGAYWLYKSAGEDVIQLFDLSVIPKNHSSVTDEKSCNSLPSFMHKARRDSLLSLGTLLYRLAHRLSLSKASSSRAKCARLFRKCLDFLNEQDHLVVRAHAHEQFARLILGCYEELDLTCESFLLESEVTVTDVEDEQADFLLTSFESVDHDKVSLQDSEIISSVKNEKVIPDTMPEAFAKGTAFGSGCTNNFAMCQISESGPHVVQTVSDPISSKLAAIHHISQAIKSLRWKRQLQDTEEPFDHGMKGQERTSPGHFPLCACGDPDCIEVCDIREWLASSKVDSKLWKLVLLLGESYLALGQAYKEDGQLHRALKVVELACSVYGSMPQHLEDTQFISSMVDVSSASRSHLKLTGKNNTVGNSAKKSNLCSIRECHTVDQFSSEYLFWSKAWTLVGDIYVEYHVVCGKQAAKEKEQKASPGDLRVPSEVVKEVKRLKKTLGQYKQNCSLCSLVNCSCQSDRASSGSSASSSSGNAGSISYGRKHPKKATSKNPSAPHFEISKDDKAMAKGEKEIGCTRAPVTDVYESTADKLGQASFNRQNKGSGVELESDSEAKYAPKVKTGGIFKYLYGPTFGDVESNLLAAIACYDAARKAILNPPAGSTEVESIVKKKGWACNELGRCRLENRDLENAEFAFIDAIKAFKEVSDHTNSILINCNLGHGRRALAEAVVSKIEIYRKDGLSQSAYKPALETAKLEYVASLKYYGAACAELISVGDRPGSVPTNLWNEVNTQYAHTYLKLGMLLAREDTSTEVSDSGNLLELPFLADERSKKDVRREISANDAIREALSIYESLGDLRKQEAAYAYFQLACYHRDCSLKFLKLYEKRVNLSRGEIGDSQKVKRYASLAERNWQKSMDFYGPCTHPAMHLTILMERAALSLSLSNSFHSHAMMESALSQLLEARHIVEEVGSNFLGEEHEEIKLKFWNQLRGLLKTYLAMAMSGNPTKSSASAQVTPTNKADVTKLRELYRMSLKPTGLSQLQTMYELWTS
ncbi:hypothetical protein H6P81_015542 [Aristolochia fimbriata]|uniref:Erythroid differentiation-related factor 1 n=1 Tax=Aristolochia fimbriata TaxID=158543 RepID=A0AAV7E5Z4_ARIFI|nr:hypothetical protein H6P81_015542 [Aristolochia fimbriata]